MPTGLLEKGNIDIDKRPVVKNPDGSISTVSSISIGVEKGEVLIPTISPDGYRLTTQAAIERYQKTGEHLGVFDSVENADAYAASLSKRQGKHYIKPVETLLNKGSILPSK